MRDLARTIVREPGIADAAHYRARVRRLALAYVALALLAAGGTALLLLRAAT